MTKGTKRLANFWSKLNFLCSLEAIAGIVQPFRSTLSDRMRNFSGTSVYQHCCFCQKCTAQEIIRILSLHGITEVKGVMLQSSQLKFPFGRKERTHLFPELHSGKPLRFRARVVSLRSPDYFPRLFVSKLWDREINLNGISNFSRVAAAICIPKLQLLHPIWDGELERSMDWPQTIW